jgi:tetratricopeptide (TPR) repeat protein
MTEKVKIRRSKLMIPTRPLGNEDALPPLAPDLTPRSYKVYPYSLQELYQPEHQDKEYETIEIENECLILTVLPELGGRLLAYDKLRKRDLFFRNSELTPVMAGLTGAWMRLGCEFNFPGSHSVTSNRHVACNAKTNSDGSATIIMSDIEWCSGMEWRISLTLHPDSAVIEQKSSFFNRTYVHNRGYFWTNAKIEAGDDTELLFPSGSQYGAVHPAMDVTRINVFKLPAGNGVDLRKHKDILFALPLFFNDIRSPFFGHYRTELDEGLIHYGACGTLPGRKFWSPGNGEDSKPVSQGGPPTFEIQSGPLPLQTDFMYIQPGENSTWKEYWMPVAGIGEFTFCTLDCAIGRKNGLLSIYATRKLTSVTINQVPVDDFYAGETRLINGAFDGDISIKAEGREVLCYSPDKVRSEPLPEYPDCRNMPEDSTEAFCLKAAYKFSRGENIKACELCNFALEKDPENSQALLLLGINAIKKREPSAATKLLHRALIRNHRDPAIPYYLGVALMESDPVNSKFYLERSLHSTAFRKPTSAVLTELMMKQNEHAKAFEFLCGELFGEDANLCVKLENLRLLEMALALADFLNCPSEKFREAIEKLSPSNIFLCNDSKRPRLILQKVLWLDQWKMPGLARENMKSYLAIMPDDPIGLYIASEILEEPQYFSKAEELPALGVFPDSFAVLNVLKKINSKSSSKLNYYLGALYASLDNWDSATKHWDAAGNQIFALRGLGLYYWKQENNLKKAAECYLKGFRLNPADIPYKYIYEMCLVLRALGDKESRAEIFDKLPESLSKNPFVHIVRCQYLFDCGKYKELLKILTDGKFSLYEGKRNTADIFIESNRKLADVCLENDEYEEALNCYKQALSYPLNLGVGRSMGLHDLKTKYMICHTLSLMGKREEALKLAKEYLQEIKDYSFSYEKLKTIRWEEDNVENDLLLNENLHFEAKIKEFLATQIR